MDFSPHPYIFNNIFPLFSIILTTMHQFLYYLRGDNMTNISMTLSKLTLPELLKHSSSVYSKNLSLNFVAEGKRTYLDLYHEVTAVAHHLISLGIEKGDRVAILSASMPNWGIAQFAIASIGAVAVPVLPGFSSPELENILNHAEVKVIFISRLLVQTLEEVNVPCLKHRILTNNFAAIPEGCYTPEELDELTPGIDMSRTSPLPETSIEEEDLASIIYTSGTTGFSKGVMLTHKNMVWDAQQCLTMQFINAEDRFLSILPMAHTYENTLGLLFPLMYGAQVYYLDRLPTPKLLVPAMQKIRPTIMLSVPLIIEKICRNQVFPKFKQSPLSHFIYRLTLGRKLLHRVAGKKLMETFGGKLRFFAIGGSKLDPTVEKFLQEAKFPYGIGYGLTETAPLSAGSNATQTFLQGVGPAMEGVSIKIDQPDKEGEGEILIKGPNVMKGYYKRPELCNEVFTPDGWFKTGDLGSMDAKGRLTIRGRIKTMILGPSGENIYPEEIESIINNFRFVNESLVVENSGRLVAMVNFNMEELEAYFQNLKSHAENYKALVQEYIESHKQELRDYVNSRVNSFSKLQMVLVQVEPFEKTPSLKIKRFLYNQN